jgi:hypothetical protein
MLATPASDTRTKKFEPPQQIIPVHIERQTLVIRVEADPCHSFSKRVTRSRSQSKVSKDRNDRRSRRIETSEKGRVRRVPQQPQSQLHVHLDLPILSLVSSSIALCSLSPSSRSFPCSIAIQHHASSLHPKPHPHPPLFPLHATCYIIRQKGRENGSVPPSQHPVRFLPRSSPPNAQPGQGLSMLLCSALSKPCRLL